MPGLQPIRALLLPKDCVVSASRAKERFGDGAGNNAGRSNGIGVGDEYSQARGEAGPAARGIFEGGGDAG